MNVPLLYRLREARGEFVPWTELGTEHAAIEANLQEFQAFGFAIDQHPERGLAYRGPAERLCPDQIEYDLGTRRVGRRIAIWNRVTSTNDLAAQAAGSVANEGFVVLAEEQTAGRGRRGRSWIAPPGSSLLMSVLLFPPAALNEVAWLTALGAVAVAEVVQTWTGRAARIKWPNDVRVDGRKIAGILVERGQGAVIGIGLNVNSSLDQFPVELRPMATSLRELHGDRLDRSELARALIRRLDEWYELGRGQGPSTLTPLWRDLSEHLGRQVRVVTHSGPVSGLLKDIDLREGLLLTRADGTSRRWALPEILALASTDSP